MLSKTYKQFSVMAMTFLALLAMASCSDDKGEVAAPDVGEEEEGYTAGLEKPSAMTVMTYENVPVIDGSDGTLPLRQLLIAKELGVEVEWGNEMSETFPRAWFAPKGDASGWNRLILNTIKMSRYTHTAFVECINGTTELIITDRGITQEEQELAQEKGVELLSRPVAKDALTFIVHADNPVQNLTLEQIRKIYTGEITNWKEVGGNDALIIPYVRNADSGTQTNMETMVMKGLSMPDREHNSGLLGYYNDANLYRMVDVHQYDVICYAPYYYYRYIVKNEEVKEWNEMSARGDILPSTKIKALSLEGVSPSRETIASGEYPVVTDVIASVRSDIDRSSVAYRLFYQMATGKKDQVIDESGYVTVSHPQK